MRQRQKKLHAFGECHQKAGSMLWAGVPQEPGWSHEEGPVVKVDRWAQMSGTNAMGAKQKGL